MNELALPKELEPCREALEATKREVIFIVHVPEKTGILHSKIGGDPYYPLGMEYPCDSKGEPMILLAQINFADIPTNDKFPKKGILQFFIPQYSDTYGWDEDNEKDKLKIIFHHSPSVYLSQRPPILWKENVGDVELYTPIERECRMEFKRSFEYLNSHVYYFPDVTNNVDYDYDEYEADENSFSSKLMGYPAFTQCDPREDGDLRDILLFQLDSNPDNVMIGDYGVMNFFISEDDLKNLDFSNVLYNWDCF